MKKTYSINRQIAAVFAAIILPALFSGCSDVKEINDMAIVSGISIDLTASGDYLVSAEVVNKTAEGSPGDTRGIISASGRTLGDALENCNFQDSRQIYFSHAKTLILSQLLVETDGVEPVLDYVMRNYKTRLSMDLLISALPDAASVTDLSTPSTGLVYYDLEEMVKTDRRYGACSPMKVYQAVNTLRQKGTELTIPLVVKDGDMATLSGTAVFSGSKMVGTLSRQETLYLLMLQNHVDTAHLTLPEYGMTFRVVKSDLDCHPSGDSSAPAINASLVLTCTVSQAGSHISHGDSTLLSEELSRSVENHCRSLVEKAQSWNSDIFGFGKSMKNSDYDFSKLPVTVSCKVNLKMGEVH